MIKSNWSINLQYCLYFYVIIVCRYSCKSSDSQALHTCYNRGTPQPYNCICDWPFYGKHCENIVCNREGGIQVQQGENVSCQCSPNIFHGKTCEELIGCYNNQTFLPANKVTGQLARCDCKSPYYGPQCKFKAGCKFHDQVDSINLQTECVCPPNFAGEFCEIIRSCDYGGILIDTGGKFSGQFINYCECPPWTSPDHTCSLLSRVINGSENSSHCLYGFGGTFCQDILFCLNGGTLIKDRNVCLCPENFSGDNCGDMSCSADGGERFLPPKALHNEDFPYSICTCFPGFTGKFCQTITDCDGGGSLVDNTCLCLPGRSGIRCEASEKCQLGKMSLKFSLIDNHYCLKQCNTDDEIYIDPVSEAHFEATDDASKDGFANVQIKQTRIRFISAKVQSIICQLAKASMKQNNPCSLPNSDEANVAIIVDIMYGIGYIYRSDGFFPVPECELECGVIAGSELSSDFHMSFEFINHEFRAFRNYSLAVIAGLNLGSDFASPNAYLMAARPLFISTPESRPRKLKQPPMATKSGVNQVQIDFVYDRDDCNGLTAFLFNVYDVDELAIGYHKRWPIKNVTSEYVDCMDSSFNGSYSFVISCGTSPQGSYSFTVTPQTALGAAEESSHTNPIVFRKTAVITTPLIVGLVSAGVLLILTITLAVFLWKKCRQYRDAELRLDIWRLFSQSSTDKDKGKSEDDKKEEPIYIEVIPSPLPLVKKLSMMIFRRSSIPSSDSNIPTPYSEPD